MSSEEDDFMASDDSEDLAPQPKKVTKAKAKASTSSKPKAAPKPKAKAASTKAAALKKAATKKTPIQTDSGDDVGGGEDVEMSFGGGGGDDSDDDDAPPPPKKASGSKKTATETYTKMSQLEHVLKRPDTYIGSVEMHKSELWVYDPKAKQMALRDTTYVPGFYKIFDEILVNAADNKVRDPTMTELRVTINKEEGSISVWNNGKGIPIQIHEKEKIYIPELIFGNLLTSSNYDDEEEKVTGGRNGYGAKLANIYSTEFIVETADKESEQKYRQIFSENMTKIAKPKITKNSKKEEFTCITFKPDFARFKMERIDDDIEGLMMKRVFDMAGTVKDIKVTLNKERLKVKGFKNYVEMYVNAIAELSQTQPKKDENGDISITGPAATGKKPTIIYEAVEDKGKVWEVAFAVSDEQFRQVSFVNNIATIKGGQHVNHVEAQINGKLAELVKKNKKNGPVKTKAIHDQLMIFVNCQIVNPTFDGQTKEDMTLKVSSFGSKWKMSEEFFKKVAKSGVMDQILSMAKSAQDRAMKRVDGSKRNRISGITKLEDANNAGTSRASGCTLILTEGDSAKALAVSGLTEVGRDNYGVFPLRGKLLNVREASHDQIMKNTEINHIKQIMGLKTNTQYTSTASLRYGSLMIMTDQDHDGSHIKGLIINFFDHFFPSLLKLPNFLVEFITPIVKVTKGKQELAFFTLPEYETWKEANADGKGWVIKYFKGLGTSDSQDAKKYFRAMNKHLLPFDTTQAGDRELIDLAFNKKKADDRKEWLRDFVPGTFLDHNVEKVPMKDFINRELILFSIADCARSIPSMVDGLKPGQRKVMFGCFKRKLKAEIKVAQLAGYVSEHSAYHHGEVSLTQTIVALAQDFCGSNNVNILSPNGQFGTRGMGGKDAASARYIFTNIPPVTRTLFHAADDALLNYLNDDGQSIEPEWYMPVIPLVLVNGGEGIGTGWSTYIPNFNPKDIVDNLRRRMAGEEYVPMRPWYRGFTGEIQQGATNHKFEVKGRITQIDEKTYEITELPVKVWTSSYKEGLEERVMGSEKIQPSIKEYKEYHTDTTVHFIVELNPNGVAEIEAKGAEAFFKITGSLATSNMVLFDSDGKIKKYSSPEEILDDFYPLRLSHYQKRKAHLVKELENLYERLSNQARFVLMIVKKELIVANRKRKDLVAELREKEFRPFPKQAKAHVAADVDDNEMEDADEPGASADFDYLLGMAIYNLTKEKVDRLLAQRDEREAELKALLVRKPQDLWEEDLDAFSAQWEVMLVEDERRLKDVGKVKKGKAPVKKAFKAGAKARKLLKNSDEDSSEEEEEEEEYSPKKTMKSRQVSGTSAAAKRVTSTSGIKRSAPIESGASGLDDEDLARLISGNSFDKPKPKAKAPSAAAKAKAAADKASSSPPKKKGKVAIPIDVDAMYEDPDSYDYIVAPKPTAKPKAGTSKARIVSTSSAKSNSSSSAKGKGKVKDESEEDEEEQEESFVASSSSPVKPRAAGRKKENAIKYAISDDDEDEEEESEDDFDD